MVALVVPGPDGEARGEADQPRPGLGIDRDHDAADRAAGRQVRCPTLLLQSADDDLDIHGDPLAIWSPWVAQGLDRVVIRSGHHQAEQAPVAVAEALRAFLDGSDPPDRIQPAS